VILALLLLAFAVGSGLLVGACEKRTSTIYTGPQEEARRNRFLAAQRLLGALGLDVRAVDGVEGLDTLPGPAGTLIIPIDRAAFTQERSDQLRAWAAEGGHLVVVTWSLWDDENRSADLILDPLGVRQFMWSAEEPEDFEEREEREIELTQVPFENRAEPLAAQFDPWFYLELEDPERHVWDIADDYGTHVLTVSEGDGYVTTLTDDYFLANDTIGNHDHAELLYRLVGKFGRGGEVTLLWNASYPGLFALLWKHGWTLVLGLVVFVAFWAWSVSRRFGPLRPDDVPERRRLMEHIEAAGRFQLAHDGERALLDAVRNALRARIAERHPGWLELAPAQQHERIATWTGISRERIDRALAYRSAGDRERFALRIVTLENIRKSL
jgi:hypothetical protein